MCDYYSTLQLILIIDFDECVGEGSGNKCEQGCVNNPGGYNCTCFDGFELVHDTECQGRTNIKFEDRILLILLQILMNV